MTNEELSQALRALAEEFGAEYSVTTISSDDDGFMHRIKIGDTTARVTYYSAITWYVGAGLLDSSSHQFDSAGALPVEHAETILAWVRAKLLEITREERIERFNALLGELAEAHKHAEIFNPHCESSIGAWSLHAMHIENELRKLAFGGE